MVTELVFFVCLFFPPPFLRLMLWYIYSLNLALFFSKYKYPSRDKNQHTKTAEWRWRKKKTTSYDIVYVTRLGLLLNTKRHQQLISISHCTVLWVSLDTVCIQPLVHFSANIHTTVLNQ